MSLVIAPLIVYDLLRCLECKSFYRTNLHYFCSSSYTAWHLFCHHMIVSDQNFASNSFTYLLSTTAFPSPVHSSHQLACYISTHCVFLLGLLQLWWIFFGGTFSCSSFSVSVPELYSLDVSPIAQYFVLHYRAWSSQLLEWPVPSGPVAQQDYTLAANHCNVYVLILCVIVGFLMCTPFLSINLMSWCHTKWQYWSNYCIKLSFVLLTQCRLAIILCFLTHPLVIEFIINEEIWCFCNVGNWL